MATASATLDRWSNEILVFNTTAAAITVTATNVGVTTDVATIAAGASAFVGVHGQRPDALNQPGSGGFDSNQGLGVGWGKTVQSVSSSNPPGAMITVTATGTVVSATLQSDGSVKVA